MKILSRRSSSLALWRAGSRLLLIAAILLAAAAHPAPARAITLILVDTTDGGLVDGGGAGDCSLAEAIANANNNDAAYADCDSGAANDTIIFADAVGAATITLSSALPPIFDFSAAGLTILGGGDITVDGDNSFRVFWVTGAATLEDLTITRGFAAYGAGALIGGGGRLQILDSTFTDNHTSGDDSLYAGGAGVFNAAGTLIVEGSTFTGNSTVGQGGAIYNFASSTPGTGTATITNSTFKSNSASGGSAGNRGGAIFSSFGFPEPVVYVYNSTFSGNSADSGQGAGIHIRTGDLYVYNTIIANSPSGDDCWFAGTTVAGSNNLIEDASSACGFTNGTGGNIVGFDPSLKAATGSPAYFPLSADSLALDAGDNTQVPVGATTDQAGNPRFADVSWAPDTGNGSPSIVDIGSYESQLSCPPGSQVYVDTDATTGNNNGHSWADAFTDLQTGIDVDDHCGGATATWVAEGVYKPGPSRSDSFSLPPGAAVYGGFAGSETLLSQRNVLTNVTVLSGDIDNNDDNGVNDDGSAVDGTNDLGNNDGNGITETTDELDGLNSYHVVFLNGTDFPILASTILDGFTITAGMANAGSPDGEGGGLLCLASAPLAVCSPTLSHLVFSGNYAFYGGAVINYGITGTSSPKFQDVTFSGNAASSNGGAVFNYGSGTSSPEFKGVTFDANSASYGGAMINGAGGGVVSPLLENITFVNNIAVNDGGAIYNFGYSGGSTSMSLTNVTFTGNSATSGGAIENEVSDTATSSATLKNVILWNDSASIGPEIDDTGGTSSLDYTLVDGGCPSGSSCTNLITSDPLLGPPQYNGGFTKTMALPPSSPAIDAGTNTGCPSTDQRGVSRPQGAGCDIGAYERGAGIFADVPVTGKEWMQPWIEAFYAHGITTGCGTGPLIYCPENQVTRAEMAVFLLRAKHGAGYTPPAPTHDFADVPVTGKEWMEPWIEQFYAEGITTGCGGGNYCPENNVTRAEMAVFVLRALHGGGYTPPALSHFFSDMPVIGKEWMEPWVDEFKRAGVTTGCGSGNYCPENNVTRAEMAVFISRAYHFYP